MTTIVTAALSNANEPYAFTVKCQNGAGAIANVTATVFVEK